jgi:hypothetical protein
MNDGDDRKKVDVEAGYATAEKLDNPWLCPLSCSISTLKACKE